MVLPTKLKPAFFSALDMASDSGVDVGASFMLDQWLMRVLPPTKLEKLGKVDPRLLHHQIGSRILDDRLHLEPVADDAAILK